MNRKAKRARLKQPCHCGSGVRYDECHYRRDKVAQGAIKVFQEKEKTDFLTSVEVTALIKSKKEVFNRFLAKLHNLL